MRSRFQGYLLVLGLLLGCPSVGAPFDNSRVRYLKTVFREGYGNKNRVGESSRVYLRRRQRRKGQCNPLFV